MTNADDFVLQLALEKGLLTQEQIDTARAIVAEHTDLTQAPPKPLEVLIREHQITPQIISKMLADEFGMPTVDLHTVRPAPELLKTLNRTLANRFKVFPIEQQGQTLKVAISDPLDVDTIDNLTHLLQLTVDPAVAPLADIEQCIERYYGKEAESLDALLQDFSATDESQISLTTPAAGTAAGEDVDAPIIKLVYQTILEAIQRRASDIHLEPMEKRFRVRYRIDGVLIEVDGPPKRLQLAVISRVKIMANISIAEKRIPQDGRIQINFSGKQIDLRVSSLPTAHGESIVMRILDKEGLQLGLPQLGFMSDDQATMEKIISMPDGIFLVTGPTGSGKTTTLYSCLHFINKPDRKLITVEDPVEYQLSGINQVPVRHEVGMTFASALRAMLRQAPNIVMVGEIRDLETAEIAINASLTGHMVFSTLHTNDAPGAVTRLIDIGVKPFLVSTSLRAVMAQRLVRSICKKCIKPYTPDARELRSLNITPQQAAGATFMKGTGCTECHNTGCRGRKGIFEIFIVNDELQRMIYDNSGSSRLREKARSLGMRTMREDGIRKVLAGITTIEEVVSITVGDSS
ncbi:type II/IV secretion system protein [Opitutaceae bacterium TAV4]|uniref:GspE/PulE family protein n=1 Tax=Geminisphaera colitermitum TaxID=1148786 RepID=UPI000196505D|nr:ATPase, T2SS/T4P/T4SS family [Geminisphaera colitermitum]RRJ97686.1 type II/IV secretion system protein [Opitutaceae bacterium TAV4]RRK02224.1 type II/IV secretion system protein [Opitutaceae bacterium TAV3]